MMYFCTKPEYAKYKLFFTEKLRGSKFHHGFLIKKMKPFWELYFVDLANLNGILHRTHDKSGCRYAPYAKSFPVFTYDMINLSVVSGKNC